MPVQPTPIHPEINKAFRAARAVSAQLHRDLLALTKSRRLSPVQWYAKAARIIESYTPTIERTLRDALLSAFLRASKVVVQNDPLMFPVESPTPEGQHTPLWPSYPNEPRPVIRFPLIEDAAQDLLSRNVVTRETFDQLGHDAKRAAFTVAKIQSLNTLANIRDALAEDVAEGGTLKEFRARIRSSLRQSPISRAHVANVYRTNLMQAYSAGQKAMLDQPIVAAGIKYVRWSAVHDRRVRPEHLAMEMAGIGGSDIFRIDDPLLLKVWPPAGFNCRCMCILYSIRDAAKAGIEEAKLWLETGIPPHEPAWVETVPIELPPGWVSSGPRVMAAV